MTDNEQSGFRGPVRVCELERDFVYPDHHWVMYATTSFSRLGKMLEKRHRNPDGSQWSIVCRYDDRGRLFQKEQAGSEGSQLLSHHYDAFGRLERVVVRSATRAERVCESYQYYETGRKASTVYPDPDRRNKFVVTLEAAFETSPEASSILTFFDHLDRPERRIFYDQDGGFERCVLMRYDITGRLVEEGESEGEDIIREDLRHVYRYDAEGRLIEKTMYHYGLYTERKKLAYNDQGDVVEEWHQHAEALPKHEKEWKTQSRYQYDDHGNWIERVAETVLQTGDRQLSMIERRRIDYY